MSLSYLERRLVTLFFLFTICGANCLIAEILSDGGRIATSQNRYLSFDLRWNRIRVAEMSFLIAGQRDEYWEVSGKTLGPLRLVKSYVGTAIQTYDDVGTNYRLFGIDEGFSEDRRIIFPLGTSPVVNTFIDRSLEKPLDPELVQTAVLVSPMELFRRIVESTKSESRCAGNVAVYDGKRAYSVVLHGHKAEDYHLRDLNLWSYRDRIFFRCSASFDSSSLIERSDEFTSQLHGNTNVDETGLSEGRALSLSKKLATRVNSWFFGTEDRKVDFILSKECGSFELVGMVLSAPLGKIVARSDKGCAEF